MKERRARVLCAICTCGARQDHGRWLLATFRFGSTSNVTTDCAERQENERFATVEGGKRVWSCGKESTQDAVLQGKGGTGCHRGKEVGELEELGKTLLDLPILVVGESLGEFGKA